MNDKVKIHTRQNKNGGFWCNTTWMCFDHSSEGATEQEARGKIIRQLKGTIEYHEVVFTETVPYIFQRKQSKHKDDPNAVGCRSWRIDKGIV